MGENIMANVVFEKGGFEPEAKEESWMGALQRNIAGRGYEALESLVGLPGNIEQLGINVGRGISGKEGKVPESILPTSENLKQRRNQFFEKGGTPPEYFEPQNVPEQFLSRLAKTGPVAAIGGGLPGLARTAIGSGVATGVGAFGGSEGAQDLAQLATEFGVGAYQGSIPTVKSAQKKAYEEARKAGNLNLATSAKPISQALKQASSELSTEVGEKASKNIT